MNIDAWVWMFYFFSFFSFSNTKQNLFKLKKKNNMSREFHNDYFYFQLASSCCHQKSCLVIDLVKHHTKQNWRKKNSKKLESISRSLREPNSDWILQRSLSRWQRQDLSSFGFGTSDVLKTSCDISQGHSPPKLLDFNIDLLACKLTWVFPN